MVIRVNPLQLENANPPMLVTLLGMVTLFSSLQLENALTPIRVTGLLPSVEGIVTTPLGEGEIAQEEGSAPFW